MAGDAKYWEATIWFDNIIPNWQDRIAGLLQIPFAYCIHDRDYNLSIDDEDYHGGGDPRKPHLHIMICFPNTTTYKCAFDLLSKLNQPGKKCFNIIRRIRNVRWFYEYLIHNTEDAKKKNKYQYSETDRITGNNFDIGAFEQLSIEDKNRLRRELAQFIIDNSIRSYTKFYICVCNSFDTSYEEVASNFQGFFNSLCRGFKQEYDEKMKQNEYFEFLKWKESSKGSV